MFKSDMASSPATGVIGNSRRISFKCKVGTAVVMADGIRVLAIDHETNGKESGFNTEVAPTTAFPMVLATEAIAPNTPDDL